MKTNNIIIFLGYCVKVNTIDDYDHEQQMADDGYVKVVQRVQGVGSYYTFVKAEDATQYKLNGAK